MNLTPPSAASRTAPLTPAAGMKIQLAVAPVSLTASATLENIGTPSNSVPPFFGCVPATTWVPYSRFNRP